MIVSLTNTSGAYDLPTVGEPFDWRDAPSNAELRRMGYARIIVVPANYDARTHLVSGYADSWDGDTVKRTQQTREIPLSQVKHDAYRRIATEFENAARNILLGYSDAERSTWPVQLEEAKAVMADADADAPLLSAIAIGTETKSDVANRVILTAARLRDASAPLVKYRRELSEAVNIARTGANVAAILDTMVWP